MKVVGGHGAACRIQERTSQGGTMSSSITQATKQAVGHLGLNKTLSQTKQNN